MSSSEAELRDLFSAAAIEPDVLAELQSIMRLHQLSAEDLYYKWESYCIKMDIEATSLGLEAVRAFKQNIQDALEKSSRIQSAAVPKRDRYAGGGTPRGTVNTSDVFGMLDGLVPNTPGSSAKFGKTPASIRRKPYETPSVSRVKASVPASSPVAGDTPSRLAEQLNSLNTAPAISFNDRPNRGQVLEVLNSHLAASTPPIAPYAEPRLKLTAASDQKKLAYKPLAMKLSEASEILDDRIDDFLELVQTHHNLDASAFGSAADQSTSSIVAVGRIASDALAGGKLNAASLTLEMSRRTGRGCRVAVDFAKLRNVALFPGQIVAVQGTNANGDRFVVDRMLDIPLLPNAASSPDVLAAHRQRMRGGSGDDDDDVAMSDPNDDPSTPSDPAPLNIFFASGPYTADDNLDFEPLHALCAKAAEEYADALVLTGPFIDADHPLIASGDFDLPDETIDSDTATLATVFRTLVAPALHVFTAANPAGYVVLVPSVRDAIDKHVAWPQDGLARRELGLPKAARLVSNPMTLSLNEAVLGVAAQDVLFELRADELVLGNPALLPSPSQQDLLSRLARHLLHQRHYFPLFPPLDRARLPKTGADGGAGLATGAMLDTSYLKLGEMLKFRPDILLTPSSLPAFAKVVDSVVVINPGYLSKRRGAGTYARMTLHAPALPSSGDKDGSGAEVLASHRVFDRAQVEIIKI